MKALLILQFFVVLLLHLNMVNSAGKIQDSSFRERAKKYCHVSKKCQLREEQNYDYGKLMRISDFTGIRPEGFLVRLPFFVIAQRDAHIVFSSTDSLSNVWMTARPNWDKIPPFSKCETADRSNSVYEIVIGGWDNSRSVIRRKMQGDQLATASTLNLLPKVEPLYIQIEISTDGKIKVFTEYQTEPFIEYHDKSPIPIEYFGFASWNGSPNKYFYNCEKSAIMFKREEASREVHLKKKCRSYEALENEYKDFFPINEVTGTQSDGYIINFPVYIQAARDAHVLLTTRPVSDRNDDCYEIVFGGWSNSKIAIRRKQQTNYLRTVQLEAVNAFKKILYLIQITTHGDIRILRQNSSDLFELVAEATDSNPIPVEYISFGSWGTNLVRFYFNCSFNFGMPKSVSTTTHHPLLAKEELPPSVYWRNFLNSKCNFYSNSDYDYKNFVPLSDIRHSKPDGYIVRLVVYLLGAHDSHVLLTTTEHLNQNTAVYEFVIGGWSNERIVLRKKQQADVLVEEFESNVINLERPTKMVIEVANNGNVRLYSENLKTTPIIAFFDENPLPVQYVSFASFGSTENQFFYNCLHIDTSLSDKP